jgi:hypothetical protein
VSVSTCCRRSPCRRRAAGTRRIRCDTAPCGCSLRGRARQCRSSRRTSPPWPRSPQSAGASTASHWRSSWRQRGRLRSGSKSSRGASMIVCTCLTGGRRTALPRHQTLRATLDWSYQAAPGARAGPGPVIDPAGGLGQEVMLYEAPIEHITAAAYEIASRQAPFPRRRPLPMHAGIWHQRADRAHHELFGKFTDAPLAEGKFETYLHERKNAKSRAP